MQPIISLNSGVTKMKKIKIKGALASTGVALFIVALPTFASADATSACTGLTAVQLSPPGDSTSITIDTTSLVPAGSGLPEYCSVTGHIDKEIGFAINLPTVWNKKIEMAGNTAFAGDLVSFDIQTPLITGYAAVATDTGHEGGPNTLLNHPERIVNFEYRAVHLVSLASKEITKTYYGKAANHSYFNGCSRGGTQGMLEAQKYPNDFDGIAAGYPNLPSGGFRLSALQALFPNGPRSGVLPAAKAVLLGQLVIQKCDALDGVTDGIVSDPTGCNFTPKKDLPACPTNADGTTCFTKAQINALEKIHEGPVSNGRSLGQPFYFSGIEGFDYGDAYGVGVDIIDFANNLSGFPGVPSLYPDFEGPGMPSLDYFLELESLRYIVFSDPKYLLQNFDYNNNSDVQAYLQGLAPQMAENPNYTAFALNGGKLVEYHGLGDSVNSYANTQAFYDEGVQAVGGLGRMKSFDRLFLVPGAAHCGGGTGPWNFDPMPTLENWVEKGNAPQKIIGNNPDTNLTRPICAYPKVARLVSPSADPNLAASFTCVNVPARADDVP
jgi:feruloyl esterase